MSVPASNFVTRKAQNQLKAPATEEATARASGRKISALMAQGRGPTPEIKVSVFYIRFPYTNINVINHFSVQYKCPCFSLTSGLTDGECDGVNHEAHEGEDSEVVHGVAVELAALGNAGVVLRKKMCGK